MKKTYLVRHLSCPNCTLKIENAISNLEGVHKIHIDLAKEKVYLESQEKIDSKVLEEIADSIEPGVRIFDEKPDFLDEANPKMFTLKSSLVYGSALLCLILAYLIDEVWSQSLFIYLPLYIYSYLVFGFKIIIKALRNILKGSFFDENLLMTIATIGALMLTEYVEAIAVMLFYRIGEYLQDRSIDHSRRSIKSLMDIEPEIAHLTTNDGIFDINPKDLLVGQLIIVRPGERIPIDGIVTEGSSWIDTKSITGESIPRDAYEGIEVISGTINISGLITVQVQKIYEDSTVQKMLDFIEHNQEHKAKTEKFMTKFAKVYTPIVVLLALLLAFLVPFILQFFATESYMELLPIYIRRSLIFLVISCPCALVLSIPLSFFAGIGAGSRIGVLFKSGSDLEQLSKTEHFIFDKTGTLTEGNFVVSAIVSGEPELILEYAAHAEYHSNHPIAESIIKTYGKPLNEKEVHAIREIAGKGVVANYRGIELLVGNHKLLDDHKIKYMKTHEIGTIVYVVQNKEYMGYIVIKDQIRKQSKPTITAFKNLKKDITLITGDYQTGAMDVTFALGIENYYANCLPEDKVHIVKELAKEKNICFIGDGMNDAPVLQASTLGIAMGGIGSDAAIEASDVVIMNDDPYHVFLGYKISKRTMGIVFQNIVLAIGIKLIVLVMGALGYANMWLAIFADVGVSILAVFNAMRIFEIRKKKSIN